jgi:hypothetical protein
VAVSAAGAEQTVMPAPPPAFLAAILVVGDDPEVPCCQDAEPARVATHDVFFPGRCSPHPTCLEHAEGTEPHIEWARAEHGTKQTWWHCTQHDEHFRAAADDVEVRRRPR